MLRFENSDREKLLIAKVNVFGINWFSKERGMNYGWTIDGSRA